jgi:hypothetical protein
LTKKKKKEEENSHLNFLSTSRSLSFAVSLFLYLSDHARLLSRVSIVVERQRDGKPASSLRNCVFS